MEKVMQPKKSVKLTEAEKKVLIAYSAYVSGEGLKPLTNKIINKNFKMAQL
jgi:hypothetical protein